MQPIATGPKTRKTGIWRTENRSWHFHGQIKSNQINIFINSSKEKRKRNMCGHILQMLRRLLNSVIELRVWTGKLLRRTTRNSSEVEFALIICYIIFILFITYCSHSRLFYRCKTSISISTEVCCSSWCLEVLRTDAGVRKLVSSARVAHSPVALMHCNVPGHLNDANCVVVNSLQSSSPLAT